MKRLVFISILCVSVTSVIAQNTLYNQGNLQVHSSATLVAFGDFSNGSSASFVNNGAVRLKRNISNSQASMNAGSGTLYLDGTAQQTFTGTQTFRVYNLVSANNSGIQLTNNLSVSNLHTFSAGIFTTSSTPNFLIYESGSSSTGSSDAAHVNGWVKKIGSSNFVYPVGNGSVLRSISLTNLSSASEFNVRHNMTTTNTANVASPLFMVDPNEYWTVNQESGGTAQLQLNWDNSKVPFPNWSIADIRVASYTSGLWTNRGGSATGNVTTTGTITSNSTSTFGAITFGSLSATLPLNLLSVSARREGDHSIVYWTTEEEYEVDHYEVERKDADGIKFFRIGQMPANNTVGVNQYSLIDYLPLAGTVQYRIRSVDRDGQYGYSNIVALSGMETRYVMKLLSNPVREKVTLSVPSTLSGSYRYSIVNNAGVAIQTGMISTSGTGIYSIYLKESIRTGHYVLTISNAAYTLTEKIIVR